MRFKYKYTVLTVLIFLLLFLPFVLKTLDMRLEIFPSVILPSSSGTIDIDKNVTVSRMELYGIAQNNDTLQIDKGQFMQPIPKHYLYQLLRNDFGLNAYEYEHAKTNRFALPFKLKSKVTTDEITETKAWIRRRIRDLGYKDSVLIVKNRRIVMAPDMSILDKTTVVNDTIYDLY
jgi:hypothetical protein